MGILSWLKRWRLDEDDFKDEIRAHLAIAAEEKRADGADPEEARYAALREFGNVTLATEATRRVWTPRWMDALTDVFSDVRYAARALAKNPIFSLTVVGVLTLGIGLNAAVFTMLKCIALAPLGGVEASTRLVVMYNVTSTGRQVRLSYPDYQYLRDNDHAFSALMGTSLAQLNLGRGKHARQISGELVTGNYFQVLGVRAQRGRTLLPSDELAPGRHPVVVISDSLWRSDFAGDPDIVGRTVVINDAALTVVGVADPAFHGTIVSYDVEAFVPVMMAAQLGITGNLPQGAASHVLSDRRATVLFPHARLRPGTTLASAVAETQAIWGTLSKDRPLTDPALGLKVVPFWQSPTGGQTYVLPMLLFLSAMGLLVLLIACANIAGLVLVRGVSRRGEIGMRLALGASRGRIVRLLVVETLLLALPGALLGVVLAYRAIPVLIGYTEWLAAPQRLFFNIAVDHLVIAFAALVACGGALVFGFMPALQSTRVDLVSVINADASPRGAARGRLRAALVVAQVAVSLLLLVGAGLVTRSVDAVSRMDPGFDRHQVAAVGFDLSQNGYDAARGRQFYRSLLDAARAAGMESATITQFTPLAFLPTRAQKVAIGGYEPRKGEDLAFMCDTIGPGYFSTLRIGLTAGRAFAGSDDETSAPVAIVNTTLAQRFWGGPAKALGKRIRVQDGEWRTVIGVASDVKYLTIDEAPRPYFYLPLFQAYRSEMIFLARGRGPVDALVAQARTEVTALDPELPTLFARPLTELTSSSLMFLTFTSMMLFIFGVAGLALAAMGTYGLVSYTVKQSTHEIGIRLALGGTAVSVVRDFVVRGLRLGAIGSALGLVAAYTAARLLRNALLGVSPADAASFGRALAIVLGGVILATIVPAWRASRTDPLSALRHQ